MSRRPFNATPFPYHHELEIEVETLTNQGQGLGRVPLETDAADAEGAEGARAGRGWVVLVPFSLPGERVRARVFRNHANYSEADLVSVLRPAPERRPPACPLFGQCGGCQYQNLEYSAQLSWKRRQVEELLRHLARVEFPVAPVQPSPREYGYRSKITPHFDRPREGRPMPIGFLRVGSRFTLVDVPRCPLASEAINARLAQVREEALAGASERRAGATLLLRELADGSVTTDPNSVALARVGGLELEFPAGDFFQNNPHILEAFTAYAADQAAGTGARHLLDAYCGSGLFALRAAGRFQQVVGVEISEAAVERAKANARRNGVANASFLAADAAAIFAQTPFAAEETCVLMDPPRKGCDETFIDQLLAYGPRSIVYVSCNPATQMRDLVRLLGAGYRLAAVQPFDLFPQTKHLECVMTLVRGAGPDQRTVAT